MIQPWYIFDLMQQKVVISVSFNGNKNCQSKALKIAAGFSGI